MGEGLYAGLGWLPAPPADFVAQCRALPLADDNGARLRWLATHALDETRLNHLARAIGRCTEQGVSLAPLTPRRLGLVGNSTLHFAVGALTASAPRHGLALECIEADYGQVMQEVLTPDSRINAAKPDVVLVALDFRGLPIRPEPGDAASAESAIGAALGYLQAIREGLRRNGNAVCIFQTLPRPVESHFGNLDPAVPGTMRHLVDAVNRGIGQMVAGTADLVFDVAALAETVGLANWHDPRLWNMAKLPFANDYLALYAEHCCRILGALSGKSRRCLVLDLDNTLWGGVIGDDGLEGIVLGQGDATGEAYLTVQQAALALRGRGVVLAVSSKNEDETARGPFRKHPSMLIREEHIAVFQANWNDKARNIEAIARELSLGTESMVLLDDNPAERALVRRLLPEVGVPELPDDPALYARTLNAAGYFEAVAFSDEDRKRAGFYQDNARRVALQSQAGDLESYLRSLQMTLEVRPFDPIGRPRIAQLISKSNQYNLTTRRYTEPEVAAMESDPGLLTIQAFLQDSFGDNGMISVVICRKGTADWEVDTWLMSCRVLGRKVEYALLGEIVGAARAAGAQRILGTYRPTDRNKLVEDHYPRLGFDLVEKRDDGSTRWEYPVSRQPAGTLPMSIRRPGEPA